MSNPIILLKSLQADGGAQSFFATADIDDAQKTSWDFKGSKIEGYAFYIPNITQEDRELADRIQRIIQDNIGRDAATVDGNMSNGEAGFVRVDGDSDLNNPPGPTVRLTKPFFEKLQKACRDNICDWVR